MATVELKINSGRRGEVILVGETEDVSPLITLVSHFLGLARDASPKKAEDKKGGKMPIVKGPTFRRAYRNAQPKKDREFVALVAVFRKEVMDQAVTTSGNVQFRADKVQRTMTNVSVAMRDAEANGDLRLVREGKPAGYEPTPKAILTWGKFVQ
jgi:hypothetical protein